jgi:hypothetical protein
VCLALYGSNFPHLTNDDGWVRYAHCCASGRLPQLGHLGVSIDYGMPDELDDELGDEGGREELLRQVSTVGGSTDLHGTGPLPDNWVRQQNKRCSA